MVCVNKVKYLLNIDWRLIRHGFYNIRLVVEVAILFGINKWDTASSILTVLEGLNHRDATAMTGQTANGEATLVEYFIQLFAKQLTMEDHMLLQAILVYQRLYAWVITTAIQVEWIYTSHNMEY